jgi:hypothetical protein
LRQSIPFHSGKKERQGARNQSLPWALYWQAGYAPLPCGRI